jgi:tRNA (guanosine-2'-O-)-methyltransferase
MKGLSPERVERREVPAERHPSCSPPSPAQLLGTPPDRSAVGRVRGQPRRPCIHWVVTGKDRWVQEQRAAGWRIVAVELADGAVSLPRLQPARQRTVVLLGHESHGVPEEQVEAADACVEIPMVGQGASLNVAVAGSLVLYRLAGLS